MYVRNYGMPPKIIKRDGEPTVNGATAPAESVQDTAVNAEAAFFSQKSEQVDRQESEISEAAVHRFGENGIPPQKPLRRRQLKRRNAETLPQILESADSSVKQLQERPPADSDQERKNCEEPSQKHSRQRIDVPFSTEDMLLGGLLLLLIGERAADDVIIALAFLLFSGFKLK